MIAYTQRAVVFISTHTPREGRDKTAIIPFPMMKNFNSHAPRGARRGIDGYSTACAEFQLTRPARGATPRRYKCIPTGYISTHTPREGRDTWAGAVCARYTHFNSHAPRGARPALQTHLNRFLKISTHTPREGRDESAALKRDLEQEISTHTPREGRDLINSQAAGQTGISTHTPREGRDLGIRQLQRQQTISTHTPREGRDEIRDIKRSTFFEISTHTPREGRDM